MTSMILKWFQQSSIVSAGGVRRLLPGIMPLILMAWIAGVMAAAAAAGSPRAAALPADTAGATSAVSETISYTVNLPILMVPGFPMPPTLPPPLIFTSTEPITFTTVISDLQNQGLELAYNKIGFHTGIGGNINGLPDWMADLDAAGVPFFLKSADNAGPLFEAQQLMEVSGVDHTLVFRRSGNSYDVPDYNLSPQEAAAKHWALHKAAWPPELDPSLVWIETINEVDKGRSEWLGAFALETAQLAMADGYRWAAFGWSSGEPEPTDWTSPSMIQFLRLAADNPDKLAVALHEYSYLAEDIGRWYPYLIGRFQELFQVCDERGIARPTVLITEWGWEYDHVPGVEDAMADIAWAAWLYAAYPQIKGAAIWYLGTNFGGIADKAQLLIAPVKDYSLSSYFGYTAGAGAIDTSLFEPEPVP